MKTWIGTWILTCIVTFFAWCQTPDARFSTLSQACINQATRLINESVSADRFEWDLCQGDLNNAPMAINLGILGGTVTTGTDIVFDGTNWFGFVTSQETNSILRLDFGPNIRSIPTVVNLGNISSRINKPTDIRIISENGNWFGFVYGLSDPLISRINFGSSLSNTVGGQSPITADVVLQGAGSVNGGFDMIHYGNNWIIVLTYNSSFRVVKMPSIDSTPTASDIITGINNPYGTSLGDIALVKFDGDYYGYVVAYGNKTLQRLNFGSNPFTTPIVENIPLALLSGVTPYGLDIGFDNGIYYLFISTLQGSLLRINLGSDISLMAASATALGNLTMLENTLKFKMLKYQSEWIAFSPSWSTRRLYRVDFPSPSCEYPLSSILTEQHPMVSFNGPGTKFITLRAFKNHVSSEVTRSITITNEVAPEIAISYDNICVASETQFMALSTDAIISHNWDFGDTFGATEPNPIHQYSQANRYRVELRVEGLNGCVNTAVKNLSIYNQPSSSFVVTPGLICTNTVRKFENGTSDTFDGNLSYKWFVNDQISSTSRDLEYTFTITGLQKIKLLTSIPGCSSEIEQTISDVKAGPVVDFSFLGKCEDAEVQFVDNIEEPVTSYSWDFQNGSPSSQDDPVHVFDAPGTYQVTLAALSPNGCNNAATKPVTIYTAPAVNFSVNPPPKSCSGSLTPFTDLTADPTDSDIATWQWDFGDPGSANNTSPLINPGHTFANAGTYDVSLTVQTDQGCASSTVKNIAIAPSPTATIENTPTCKGLPVSFLASGANISGYYWEVGTVYYDVPNPTHTFNAAGNFPMRLTVTGTNSCQTVYNKIINVPVPLTADFSVTKNCVGSEALFTDLTAGADPVEQRNWDFGGEGTGSGASPLFQFNAAGNKLIILQVVSQAGCQYTTSKSIHVSVPPVADFTSQPEPAAATLPVQFTNASTGAAAYLWTFGDGSGTSTLSSPMHSFNLEGEYTVELTAIGAQGCEDRQTKTVTVVTPLPDVDLKLITVTENADGSLKIIITIHNKGNTLVTALPVVIDISGETTLTETLKEPVLPASQYNLVLNYGINVNDDLKFLCASIDLPNDLTPAGNRICKELGGRVSLFTAYPNPAVAMLNIGWVAPKDEVVAILLVDSFGKKVLEGSVSSTEGLNTAVLDVSRFRDGIYFLVLNGGSVRSAQRVLISGQN